MEKMVEVCKASCNISHNFPRVKEKFCSTSAWQQFFILMRTQILLPNERERGNLLFTSQFLAFFGHFSGTYSAPPLSLCLSLTVSALLSISQLDTYLQLKGTQLEREMAAEIILRILDKVMQNAQSLNSQQVSNSSRMDNYLGGGGKGRYPLMHIE